MRCKSCSPFIWTNSCSVRVAPFPTFGI